MIAEPAFSQRTSPPISQAPAQAFACVAAAMFAVFALFAGTSVSMVETWQRSETYSHGFLVVPVVLWLIWRRRESLAATPIRPSWPILVVVAIFGMTWLLAEFAGTRTPAQLALIGMVVGSTVTVFGWGWARELAFPLAFLFFAVPFGEAFVPTLIDWTADFTVAAVKASGVPVYREGAHFVIPSGHWSVVEACSGIRYLMASAVTGSLYAWLMYRSWPRRTAFIAAAAAFPIVANWIRAYGIVMLGHWSDNRIATGVDHLVYGWVFFGIVMFILFIAGARWREDSASEPPRARSGVTQMLGPTRFPLGAATLAGLVLAAWPLAHAGLTAPRPALPMGDVSVQAANGWMVAAPVSTWKPAAQNPSAVHTAWFARNGQFVGVYVVLYRDQQQGAELVNSQNVLAHEKDMHWRETERKNGVAATTAGALAYRGALLRSGEQRLAVWHWYWLGDRTTASDIVAKVDLAFDRLLRRDDTSAWVIVVTPVDGGSLSGAGPALSAFARDMGASIDDALRRLRR